MYGHDLHNGESLAENVSMALICRMNFSSLLELAYTSVPNLKSACKRRSTWERLQAHEKILPKVLGIEILSEGWSDGTVNLWNGCNVPLQVPCLPWWEHTVSVVSSPQMNVLQPSQFKMNKALATRFFRKVHGRNLQLEGEPKFWMSIIFCAGVCVLMRRIERKVQIDGVEGSHSHSGEMKLFSKDGTHHAKIEVRTRLRGLLLCDQSE